MVFGGRVPAPWGVHSTRAARMIPEWQTSTGRWPAGVAAQAAWIAPATRSSMAGQLSPPLQQVTVEGEVLIEPDGVMECRSEIWHGIRRPATPQQHAPLVQRTRRLALEQATH